jgi:hypothetical protein
VATKKPSKAQIVSQTKRANNRLKVIGETCLNLAQGRDTRPPERVHKQINARLDRELTPEDIAGPALRAAVEVFWQRGDEDSAIAVYEQVRQVQRDRWRQVEAKHGKVSHYFDAFGQIKPRCRRDALPVKKPAPSIGWLMLLVAAMVLVCSLWKHSRCLLNHSVSYVVSRLIEPVTAILFS